LSSPTLLLHNAETSNFVEKPHRSLRLTVFLEFHKRITNPTITHADKVMLALSECVKAIKGLTGQAKTSQKAKDLQRIVDATRATRLL
jgi:hypothetical protein